MTLAMRFTYHPATGHKLLRQNGSEMYREGLRRLLDNSDIESKDEEISTPIESDSNSVLSQADMVETNEAEDVSLKVLGNFSF